MGLVLFGATRIFRSFTLNKEINVCATLPGMYSSAYACASVWIVYINPSIRICHRISGMEMRYHSLVGGGQRPATGCCPYKNTCYDTLDAWVFTGRPYKLAGWQRDTPGILLSSSWWFWRSFRKRTNVHKGSRYEFCWPPCTHSIRCPLLL